MKIVNPLNRVPETDETMVMACGCICYSGSAIAKSSGSASNTCKQQCNSSIAYNNVYNLQDAIAKAR